MTARPIAATSWGELPKERLDYIRFHLEEVDCAACSALLAELGAPAASAPAPETEAERAVRERLQRSTSAFLGTSRAARRR